MFIKNNKEVVKTSQTIAINVEEFKICPNCGRLHPKECNYCSKCDYDGLLYNIESI